MTDEYVYNRTGVKVRAHQIEDAHTQGGCGAADPEWFVELTQRPAGATGRLTVRDGVLHLGDKWGGFWALNPGDWVILWAGGDVEYRTNWHFSDTFDRIKVQPATFAINTTSTGLATSNLGREWSPFVLIPNQSGAPFKAESRRDGEEPGTLERFTVWIFDDPRSDPHTHPWPFTSEIVTGGYTEDRYRLDSEGNFRHIGSFVWRAGDTVHVPEGEAHVVYNVLPGTTTHMKIGKPPVGPRHWGHLVPDADGVLRYVPNESDPAFMGRLKALNTRPT